MDELDEIIKRTKGHTPGEWKWAHRKCHDQQYRTQVYTEEHGTVSTCAWTPKPRRGGRIGTYREANAALLAAAPSLLRIATEQREQIRELVEALGEALNFWSAYISVTGNTKSEERLEETRAVLDKYKDV
jgi:hypothetical protein